MLFDSHAHINEASYSPEERAELIKTIEASDVDYVADIGYDLASSKLAVEHAARYPWCYAVVGCHPHDAKSMDDMELAMCDSCGTLFADKLKSMPCPKCGSTNGRSHSYNTTSLGYLDNIRMNSFTYAMAA